MTFNGGFLKLNRPFSKLFLAYIDKTAILLPNLMSLRVSLHLRCIVRKLIAGQPITFHVQGIMRELSALL